MDVDKIVVAMSGGVDSCAAAVLLKEEGHQIIGVSMQVWDYRKNGGNSKKATCCAPADFEDARIVSEEYDFPYYVFEFEDSFHDSVIKPFVDSYLAGYTPNPCLNCNRYVKFRELRDRAKALGAKKVATGHYAQIKQKTDSSYGLFTSKDRAKDQSYFLYAMTQSDLENTLFPVGGMKKDNVREFLDQRGQEVAEKEESQDICFVSDKAGKFVEKYSDVDLRGGTFIDSTGNELGTHTGVHNFTVGQRRGLGIGGTANPLYVLAIDSQSAEVLVGEKEELKKDSFKVSDVNWCSGVQPKDKLQARVKMRYRHEGEACELTVGEDGGVIAEFTDTWSAVSPGQAAVFYGLEPDSDGDFEVFGGGIIEKDEQ